MGQKSRKNKINFYFLPTPKFVGILALFGIVVYGSAYAINHLMYKTKLFKVEVIQVTGNKYLNEKLIKELANIETDQPLFRVGVKKVVKNILENNYVKAASVSQILPSTIIIDVEERQPEFLLKDHKKIYMVDQDAIILENISGIKPDELPVASGISVKSLLEDKSPLHRLIELIQIIRNVDSELLVQISQIQIKKDDWPVFSLREGGGQIWLGQSAHYERIYYWSELFNQPTVLERLEKVKRLDFTFSNRVVIEYKS
jgi:cell division septal protein FtsQ